MQPEGKLIMRQHKAISLFVFAILALLFQTPCYAMAPDYGLGTILQYAVYTIVSVFFVTGTAIGFAVGRIIVLCNIKNPSRYKGGLIGALVGACVSILLLLAFKEYILMRSKTYNKGIKDMYSDRKVVAKHTEAILLDRCKTEEKLIINKTIPYGSSIFVNLFPDKEPPTAINAPSVVPTPAMKEQYRKYGQSFPPMYNDEQYKKLISWVETADAPESIGRLARTDLVDSRDRFKTHGKDYYRVATKQRWEKDGLSKLVSAYTENYIDDYKFKNWPKDEFKMRIPIDKPNAQYILTVEDISTLEDRDNWLARGRIRLSRTRNSEVIAEYIGFQSLLTKESVCPSAINSPIKVNGSRDLLPFFFGKVLK